MDVPSVTVGPKKSACLPTTLPIVELAGWVGFRYNQNQEEKMPNHPIRIGVQLQIQHAEYSQIRAAAQRAEEIGADVLFNWDHFYPLYGDGRGKHFECWTMLAAWGESTSQVEIGALVTCNSYRNPDLLADMTRTVDHISGGRAILGIGSGWFRWDYDSYGYEFGTAGSRLDDLAAALPRIETRFSKLNPPPLRKIPILIGGMGEKKTLRLVARHADIWHGFGSPEVVAHKNSVIEKWCEVEGRDSSEIERSCGAPADDISQGDKFLEAGATFLVLSFGGPDFDLSPVADWIAWRDEKNA